MATKTYDIAGIVQYHVVAANPESAIRQAARWAETQHRRSKRVTIEFDNISTDVHSAVSLHDAYRLDEDE